MSDSIREQLLKMGLISQEAARTPEKRGRSRKTATASSVQAMNQKPAVPNAIRRRVRSKIIELMNRSENPTQQGQRSRFYVECTDGRLTYVLLDEAGRRAVLSGRLAVVEPVGGPVGLMTVELARQVQELDSSAILFLAAP